MYIYLVTDLDFLIYRLRLLVYQNLMKLITITIYNHKIYIIFRILCSWILCVWWYLYFFYMYIIILMIIDLYFDGLFLNSSILLQNFNLIYKLWNINYTSKNYYLYWYLYNLSICNQIYLLVSFYIKIIN